MVQYLSRRSFLSASAATLAVAMTSRANSPDAVPESLDHILLGCNNLDSGIAFVEAHTGIRATPGGAHPGAGTHNALLSLGERHYLEIIAPDPAQPDSKNPLPLILTKLTEPRLVGWAAHPANISALAEKLRKAGVPFEGPVAGSRKRLDGHILHWQVLHLKTTPPACSRSSSNGAPAPLTPPPIPPAAAACPPSNSSLQIPINSPNKQLCSPSASPSPKARNRNSTPASSAPKAN